MNTDDGNKWLHGNITDDDYSWLQIITEVGYIQWLHMMITD